MHACTQAKLRERDEALEARQAQVLELHTELSQLQRMLQQGPSGGGCGACGASSGGGLRASGGLGGSPGRRFCLTPPRRLRTGGSGERSALQPGIVACARALPVRCM